MKTMANLFLVILLLFVASCSKQAIDTPKPDTTTIHASAKSIKIRISLRPRYYDRGGDQYGCEGIDGNCLPEVVVVCTPLKQTMQAVDDNDSDSIITIFENNRQEMTDVLASEDAVNGVINKELSLSIRGAVGAPIRYLLFTDNSDGEIVEAVPVKSD